MCSIVTFGDDEFVEEIEILSPAHHSIIIAVELVDQGSGDGVRIERNGSFSPIDGEQVGDGVADKDSQDGRQDHPQFSAPLFLASFDVLFPLLQFIDLPLKESYLAFGGPFEIGDCLLHLAECVGGRIEFLHRYIQTVGMGIDDAFDSGDALIQALGHPSLPPDRKALATLPSACGYEFAATYRRV